MRNTHDYKMLHIFSSQLRDLRSHFSQDVISTALGVRRASISDWENGKALPSLGLFFRYLFVVACFRSLDRTETFDFDLPDGVRCTVKIYKK